MRRLLLHSDRAPLRHPDDDALTPVFRYFLSFLLARGCFPAVVTVSAMNGLVRIGAVYAGCKNI